MARTIDYLTLMVNVTPYEYQGHKYNALSIIVAFRKGCGFVVTWQPVQITAVGYMTGPMPSSDPLVGGKGFTVKAATRNSVKVLETMKAALLLAKDGIKFFFDQRNYDALKEFMGDVCNYGYSEIVKKKLEETIANYNAMSQAKDAEPELSPMMKQFRDLKSKHPDAVLLFRCGDFYETYEKDAKTCADVLGITLTWRTPSKRHAPGDYTDAMACFPYHALDTYLPKLIRAGHRVAICDQLEDPKLTKKLVKRGIVPTSDNNENNNNSNSQETMKLTINNNNESANVHNAQVINPTNAGVAPVIPSAEPIEDAEFEEIKDEPAPAPKKAVTIKRKVTLKRKEAEPVKEEVKAEFSPTENATLPKVTFSTYTTKRGDTAPQIVGFGGEDDPRWKSHKEAEHKYVSASWKKDIENNKVYILMFGTRYMDVAKALCGAYNTDDREAWKRAEDACMAIYEQAVRDGKAKWEAKKAAWAEKAAEKKAKKEADKKCYTKEDVAAIGGELPADLKKLIKAA